VITILKIRRDLMKVINKELIPNKCVLSCGLWSNSNNEEMFVSVTRGIATKQQKNECYQQFVNELTDDEVNLNNNLFSNNTFELWHNKKLIGLCSNSAIARDWMSQAELLDKKEDIKYKNTIFITCDLKAVFILKQYRGKELSDYFTDGIRDPQMKELLSLLSHQSFDHINHIDVSYSSEPHSEGGEHFHYLLYTDDIREYMPMMLSKLGYSHNVTLNIG
jgi:hypothetical protein